MKPVQWLTVVGLTIGCYGNGNEGVMPTPGMVQVRKAQISDLYTTGNALGSFSGPQVPNLQIDHLDAGEYSLQFQVIEPPIDALGYATYAIIRWKVQGQQIQRIISVFSGAVIGGVAQAVDVTLLDQSDRSMAGFHYALTAILVPGSPTVTLAGGGAAINLRQNEQVFFNSQPGVAYSLAAPVVNVGAGGVFQLATPYTGPAAPAPGSSFWAQSPYKVGVALSKGTRPTIMQPPVLLTSKLAQTIAPASLGPVAGIAVPQDAGVISILTSVVPTLAPNVSLVAANEGYVLFGQAGGLISHSYIPGTPEEWYPIPPGTTNVSFGNANAGGGASLNFTYQWGIEG
jgi:hypothetical protein